MSTAYRLGSSLFDDLAEGGGGAPAIDQLRAMQVSKHLLLVTELLQEWPGRTTERDAVIEMLDRARQRSPLQFAAVLGAPLVGAWVAIANRALRRGVATAAEFGHLTAVAVVACAAAGADAGAEVPVRDGIVAVPGLGVASVIGSTARLASTGGRLMVVTPQTTVEVTIDESPQWRPVRWLRGDAAGLGIKLVLDDVDPYRHGHHAPPAPRLPADEVDRWRTLFVDAWYLLAHHRADRATELAAGLRTLVPLWHEDERSSLSATIRDAFGVFGLTRPPSAAEFAVTLVHEFQHSKLSAILDLLPLTDPADRRRFFAPWRVDPRPLSGLLQGVYAFVGVADTWRGLRAADDIGPVAEAQFAEARWQVHHGLTSVERSGALTTEGEALVARLRIATDRMLAEPVAPQATAAAERALQRTRERWVARNGVIG